MALTLAIPLSGMEFHQFHGILNRCDLLMHEQPISPVSSTFSDSSGISSLTLHTDITTPSLSPIMDYEESTEDNNNFNVNDQRRVHQLTSRMSIALADLRSMDTFYRQLITPSVLSQTCQPIGKPHYRLPITKISSEDDDLKIIYESRNILNLGANLRRTFWQMRTPTMPNNTSLFCDDNNIDSCQSSDDQFENYCPNCNFCEP